MAERFQVLVFLCFRLEGFDDGAAKVGITDCTQEPTPYDHPGNSKIKFWDLPGIGTPRYPVETYYDQVQVDKYHTFLIFTDTRFRENDFKLAEKITSIDKKFFFIRTKIDENARAEKRSKPPGSFNEEAMLEEIRADCSKNLGHLKSNTEDIFLISNHHPAKWEFDRLRKAILDALPRYQRESLTLSLGVLKSLSSEMLKRKVEVLRGRIWMVASVSAATAMFPIPGLSVVVDIALMIKEITFYRNQLGLPEEDSTEFANLQIRTQEKVRSVCLTTAAKLTTFLTAYAAEGSVEEFARFIPLVGSAIAGGTSFATTYYGLQHCLEKMEEVALTILDEAAQKSANRCFSAKEEEEEEEEEEEAGTAEDEPRDTSGEKTCPCKCIVS